MVDSIGTEHTTANTTTPAGTATGASYEAEAVKVQAAPAAAHDDKSATKGLIVGVLTFLALSLWEWLDGRADADTNAGAAFDSITFVEMLIYAVVGIIVGVVVKAIDKSRQKKAHA